MNLKQQAAEYAVDHYIQSGMIVGLGMGSTAIYAVRHLAAKLKSGQLHDIVAIPCGLPIEQEALALQIPLATLEEKSTVDVTIDGADEVDPALNLIKGGGGALMREKIVAEATRFEVIVVDESKLVPVLGTNWAIPIEVAQFGWGSQARFLKSLGGEPVLRLQKDGTPFVTDQGNLILDSKFGLIHVPETLATQLNNRAGILEHGLFLGIVAVVIVAGESGIKELKRPE